MLKLGLHDPLSIHVIVRLVVQIVIEGPKHLVNISDCLLTDVLHHIVVVLQSKVVVESNDIACHPFSHINHDVLLCPQLVLHYDLRLWQVNVEVIQTLLQMLYLLVELLLLMIKLYEREGVHLVDQGPCLELKSVHLCSHFVLLL